MAEDEPTPGPSGLKRKRSSKQFEGFVTSDVDEVIGLLEDDEFTAFCEQNLSEDSFDEEERDDEPEVRTGMGDIDTESRVRADISREERAELEAEYASMSDPDFEPDDSRPSGSTSEG